MPDTRRILLEPKKRNRGRGLPRLLVRGCRRVFRKGFRDTARTAWFLFYEWNRERRLGICTARREDHDVQMPHPCFVHYEPISYTCLDHALARLKIRPGVDVLLDYGSGMGRAVAVASTHPFRRVIGIDLLPELNVIAAENLRRLRARQCAEVEFVTADATTWPVPSDVTVILMFNPFTGPMLGLVIEQICDSLRRVPRKLSILYLYPISQENLFDKCPWLTTVAILPTGIWKEVQFVHYETVPLEILQKMCESTSVPLRLDSSHEAPSP